VSARVILVVTHERCGQHESGIGHPERPARLAAALAGAQLAGLDDAIELAAARPASTGDLRRVHDAAVIDRLSRLDEQGGGRIDTDTAMNAHSFEAALVAAGAGLVAVDELRAGRHRAALCVVRPPGHHAAPSQSMGFCLFNSIAVAAAALVAQGERVAIVDYDAHHGNGTQDAFYATDRVLFVSLHQYPWYPGTGAIDETGVGDGAGHTVNIPFAAGTSGDAYRLAFDEIVVPKIERFAPTWLLVSAGFDGHRLDPLAQLGLTAGDYGDLASKLARLVPPGRIVAFLEGGYHLDALTASVGTTIAAFADTPVDLEARSSGSRAEHVVAAVRAQHGLS
jgi:acetoin utilization deacetylase AcuC-like enzyme